jgi:hypothetical protein
LPVLPDKNPITLKPNSQYTTMIVLDTDTRNSPSLVAQNMALIHAQFVFTPNAYVEGKITNDATETRDTVITRTIIITYAVQKRLFLGPKQGIGFLRTR